MGLVEQAYSGLKKISSYVSHVDQKCHLKIIGGIIKRSMHAQQRCALTPLIHSTPLS
jgi:hypothetical protein